MKRLILSAIRKADREPISPNIIQPVIEPGNNTTQVASFPEEQKAPHTRVITTETIIPMVVDL
jgi:hypothetical protein